MSGLGAIPSLPKPGRSASQQVLTAMSAFGCKADSIQVAPMSPLLAKSGLISCIAKDRGLILLFRVTKARVLVHEIRDGGLFSSAEAAFRGDTEPFDGR